MNATNLQFNTRQDKELQKLGYGIAKRMGRTHFLLYDTQMMNTTMLWIKKTVQIFPNLEHSFVFGPKGANITSVKLTKSCCEYVDPISFVNYTAKYLFFDFRYGRNPLYFTDYLNEIRKLLEFSSDTRREGQYILDTLKM
ncbi:hypothetical protein RB195_017511 [Necator americanus]|uniref:Uncharacterized protein n=1 Tax=Necator americanus TaxID=51031 RepID=A0ABR1C7P5_NECAM